VLVRDFESHGELRRAFLWETTSIHNGKQRMPAMLAEEDYETWLSWAARPMLRVQH
jgi:hypothetical protein